MSFELGPRPSPVVSVYLALLALQLALQPFLSRRFISPAVSKVSLVIACELCKVVIALGSLPVRRLGISGWRLKDSLAAAGPPALIYTVQNVCVQFAYTTLSPTLFQLLNQTKVFWSALFGFLILGQRQTKIGCVALVLLVCAAVAGSWPETRMPLSPTSETGGPPVTEAVLLRVAGPEVPPASGAEPSPAPETTCPPMPEKAAARESPTLGRTEFSRRLVPRSGECPFSPGLAAAFSAALLSGLASTLSQWTLQGKGRDTFLFGGEMAVYTVIPLAAAAGKQRRLSSLFVGWTAGTSIPVLTCALGGLLVGLVTKHAGNVAKGYAIVTGILLTGFLEGFFAQPSGVPARLWVALPLVAGSTILRLSARSPLRPADAAKRLSTRRRPSRFLGHDRGRQP